VVVDTNDDDDFDGVTCKIAQVFQERSECLLLCEGRCLTRTIRQLITPAEDTHTVAVEAKALLRENLPSFHELMEILQTSTNGQLDVRSVAETLISNTITAWNDEAFVWYAFEGRQCQYCCKMIDTSGSVLKCSKCTMAYYCDRECQRKDWTRCADTVGDHAGKHRKQCVSMKSIALLVIPSARSESVCLDVLTSLYQIFPLRVSRPTDVMACVLRNLMAHSDNLDVRDSALVLMSTVIAGFWSRTAPARVLGAGQIRPCVTEIMPLVVCSLRIADATELLSKWNCTTVSNILSTLCKNHQQQIGLVNQMQIMPLLQYKYTTAVGQVDGFWLAAYHRLPAILTPP